MAWHVARLHRDPASPDHWIFTSISTDSQVSSLNALIPDVQRRCVDLFPDVIPINPSMVDVYLKDETVPMGTLQGGLTVGIGWDCKSFRFHVCPIAIFIY